MIYLQSPPVPTNPTLKSSHRYLPSQFYLYRLITISRRIPTALLQKIRLNKAELAIRKQRSFQASLNFGDNLFQRVIALSLLKCRVQSLIDWRGNSCQIVVFIAQQNSFFILMGYIMFSIIKLEKNHMALLHNHKQASLIRQKLNQLIELTPTDQRTGLSEIFTSKTRKVVESSTLVAPKEILEGLIAKTSLSLPRKNWKLDETNYLLYVIDKYCLLRHINFDQFDAADWNQISQYLPGRSPQACQFRFLALSPSSITAAPWSAEERDLLLRIIQIQNSTTINWKKVSQKLYEVNPTRQFRTGKQCREHYTCFLKPNLKKGSWTDQEDYELICLFLKHGKKWSKMAKHIEGRNQNAIKNRFFLMFENKKESRLTNSDLVKVVKRRKEKIERKMQKSLEESLQEKIMMSSAHSQSFGTENEQQIREKCQEQCQRSDQGLFQESQIFLQECPVLESGKNGEIWEHSSYQFEQYITF